MQGIFVGSARPKSKKAVKRVDSVMACQECGQPIVFDVGDWYHVGLVAVDARFCDGDEYSGKVATPFGN